MAMIREIKGYKVLAGARGRARPTSTPSRRVGEGRLAGHRTQDQIAELDINPLLVLPEGQGACVADALVVGSAWVRKPWRGW